jgi:hypothetical protein
MMAYKKMEQTLTITKKFEKSTYPDYDDQIKNTTENIKNCVDIIAAFNPALKSFGILESLTNKFTITTKMPLQFNIIKKNIGKVYQLDRQIL